MKLHIYSQLHAFPFYPFQIIKKHHHHHHHQVSFSSFPLCAFLSKSIFFREKKGCAFHIRKSMAAEGGVGDEFETTSMSSGSLTPLSSPRKNSSVKLLCSHGGKILPRPSDGQLKYIGGETRVVSILRDMNYSDLMKKLHEVFNEEMMLKYQLTPEDLDTLVSVKTDEDVKHMLEEYDRHDIIGTPKLRAFLYPLKLVPADRPAATDIRVERPAATIETRAINGVGRPSPNLRITPIRSFWAGSSTCSSPLESPESRYNSGDGNVVNNNKNEPVHKVQSSPSLVSLNLDSIQQYSSNGYNNYQHHHNHYHPHGQSSHTPPKHPQDPYRNNWGERRLMRSTSSRHEPGRAQHTWSAPPEMYYPNTRQYCRDYGHYSRSERYDEYGNLCGSSRFDRTAESLPHSPR